MEKYLYLLPILLVPLIAALIGWFTNYIAIKMLFHPRIEKKFLFVKFQGVFPKRQKQLAEKLGELFSEQLGIQAKIEEKITGLAEQEFNSSFLAEKVKLLALEFINKELPMVSAFLPDSLIDSLSQKVAVEIKSQLISQISQARDSLGDKINVKDLVAKEIEALSSDSLEKILNGLLQQEFRFIEVSGAVLGFIIGIGQLLITQLFTS